MEKFTDIGQFRQVVREVRSHWDFQGKDEHGDAIYAHKSPYPTLKFRGTVKSHGTNAGIVKYKDRYAFQSREREITPEDDNDRFAATISQTPYSELFDGIEFNEYCAIFGEWCGKGIQKSVGINELPRMFIIFGIKIDGVYQDLGNFKHLKNHEHQIFNMLEFPSFEMMIDFNTPELIQNELVKLTLDVEHECPIAKYFGVSGTGEGIVWEHNNGNERYIFKVKGEKHQNSKVKTLTTVDVEAIENLNKFIEYAVTENRMKQGIDKMVEMGLPLDPKTTGDYLRWVYNDVVKEESDTMEENGIDPKKIGSAVAAKARIFWLNYLNTNF